ncbi:MAG TPA: c-type cytochrome domain-containing protein, partial [Lacipirellulaceae bacterium]|nr:c-type cytochrome domain-containing protein [Lacipirellulaceae bacterium]
MWRIASKYCFVIVIILLPAGALAAEAAAPDYERDVAPIFAKYCAGCHNGNDRAGELSLESFAELQKGGEKGAAVLPGRADASLMIRALTGEIEPSMPPPDNPRPGDKEVKVLRDWIDGGAAGPSGSTTYLPAVKAPSIATAPGVHAYLTSLALSPDGKRLALGSYQHVELVDAATKQLRATTDDLPGKVMAVAFSSDGSRFVAASGLAGLYGVATICKSDDGSIIAQIKGHRDAIYDAQFSPNGQLLATCSYDRVVDLWNVADGKLIRSMTGHNGAVYHLAFSPDGSVLASASADATVKLWSVKTGERLDTLGQAEGEQFAAVFTPESNSVLAGGADRQLRQWAFVSRDKPATNPLTASRTAHASTILKLAITPNGKYAVTASQGRELVLWDAKTLTPLKRFEALPDVVTGLAFAPDSASFYVACINGDWQKHDLPEEAGDHSTAAERTSEVTAAEPSHDPPAAAATSTEQEPNNSPGEANPIGTNDLVTGVISAGDKDHAADNDLFRFQATKGQRLVFEIDAARSKSPLDSKLEVLTAEGKPIPRVVLQAVRGSYFTFRGHDSVDPNDIRMQGAADMEINDYVYSNGDVMRLWLLPHGPDSGFTVYPGTGPNRFAYFGSTAITHALNESCYIVEPHDPVEKLIPNGLPIYTLYYENDDDGWRKLGTDSRIAFTAPTDGDYLVRVSDARGMGGEKYSYELSVRPARPDFEISIGEKNLAINAGSGKEFSLIVDRKDEFDGPINVAVSTLPRGFHVSSPLTIEAGQVAAFGTFTADADAPDPAMDEARNVSITASATLDGNQAAPKSIKVGELKLAPKPKFLVRLMP